VILYELLTGSQPFPAGNRSRSEVLNAITTQDPVPPSAAMSASSMPSQREVGQAFKGDLDAIVLHAMHRDPARRYQSAAELNADINRYLESRPISARKISFAHRNKMFYVRHRGAVLAMFLICALLATTIWQGVVMHERYERSQELEKLVHQYQIQGEADLKAREAELKTKVLNNSSGSESSQFLANQLQDAQMEDVRHLAETYRTSFSEAVRIWPGMTNSRRNLLDQADRYLREAEPLVSHDPKASEQLATAWMGLANLQGNPQTVNLHDSAGAENSINEAKRLLEKSSIVSSGLLDQVKAAAQQIEAGRN
jgi:serine/threonine-protein kinase